jgi:glycerol-3-phosphate acyltransferase PlsY
MKEVLIMLAAYLIGSIPSSVWLGKLIYKKDVREEGSGNAGATNTIRVLGWQIGVVVLILDALKGWFAVYLADIFPAEAYIGMSKPLFQIVLAVCAVLGHIFPIYVGFKGGKGVATLLGVAIAIFPWQVILIELAVFFLIFITSRIVSLGSIIVAISLPLLMWLVFPVELPILILAIVIAIFIPVTHHKNIGRLLRGEEKRLEFKKS